MDDPSFSRGQRVKLEEISEGAAEPMGMAGATPEDVLKVACSKYTLGRTLALDAMRERELSLSQLQKGGVERLNLGSPFNGKTKYATVYVFSDRAAANRMVDMWANVIGVGARCLPEKDQQTRLRRSSFPEVGDFWRGWVEFSCKVRQGSDQSTDGGESKKASPEERKSRKRRTRLVGTGGAGLGGWWGIEDSHMGDVHTAKRRRAQTFAGAT